MTRPWLMRFVFVAYAACVSPSWAQTNAASLDKIEQNISEFRSRVKLVQDAIENGELTLIRKAKSRYSEAETQFLLDNYEGATALLFDAIDVAEFHADPTYPNALYYLAESLYQQQSYLESRRYFREAVDILKPGRQYQDTLVRLMALADRTGDFSGIDQYYDAARKASTLRSEVTYLYAKWTSRRKDLPADVRLAKAAADFKTVPPNAPYFEQSVYFLGTIALQQGNLDEAQSHFQRLVDDVTPKIKTTDPTRNKESKLNQERTRILEMAQLSLARIFYEKGLYSEALDRYQSVATSSVDYTDAMIETASTFVKMGSFEQALRTADILAIIARDTAQSPEARTLQANLQMKLALYDKAGNSYQDIVQTYGPVRDQVQSVLSRPNPAEYFDSLMQEKSLLDIDQLLPPLARPFVKTTDEVRRARQLSSELTMSQKGIDEGNTLADRLLEKLSKVKLTLFPEYYDANSRAIQLSNALATEESALLLAQIDVLKNVQDPEIQEKLKVLRKERTELDELFKQLPKTQNDVDQRTSRFAQRLKSLEKQAFTVRQSLDSLLAQMRGLQKYSQDTRDQRTTTVEQEDDRSSELKQNMAVLDQLDEVRTRLDKEISKVKGEMNVQISGGEIEEDLRTRSLEQMAKMNDIIQTASQNTTDRALLDRMSRDRQQIEDVQSQLTQLRGTLRMKVQTKADVYRQNVQGEKALLADFQKQLAQKQGDTRPLIGQIAFRSFSNVGSQLSNIVLKGDVGTIDVAWVRKTTQSDHIRDLAKDKDIEIKKLEARFQEVIDDN